MDIMTGIILIVSYLGFKIGLVYLFLELFAALEKKLE